ncbi:hypothetical protein PSAC2689_50414 [Paraburkholderia sacchari]
MSKVRDLLADIVGRDDWLPDQYAQPEAQYYQQYLLYADPADRCSIVSFVWDRLEKARAKLERRWAVR